jgi:hypothetical protein
MNIYNVFISFALLCVAFEILCGKKFLTTKVLKVPIAIGKHKGPPSV